MKISAKSALRKWILITGISLLLGTDPSFGQTIRPAHLQYYEDLADAIYIAEGGSATRFPYGIGQEQNKEYSHEEARRLCIMTISNNLGRWLNSETGFANYITFLAHRYCPKNSRTWAKNVRWIYENR